MVVEAQQLSLFDYTSLDTDTRLFVQEKAQAIHTRLKRTAEDIIAIGQDLIEVKDKLPDMKFSAWLRTEFDMSRPTAYRFMSVASRFRNSCLTVRQLTARVLYELASPTMPETIIQMVETGQIPATLPAIREAKQEIRQSLPPSVMSQHIDTSESVVSSSHPYTYPSPMYIDDYKDIDEEEMEILLDEVGPENAEAMQELADLPHHEEPVYVPSPEKVQPSRSTGVPAALQMSESNEWYTPTQYVEVARALMGGIDVDPAGNAYVNEKVVRATTYYDIRTNGLLHDWPGRIWLNPPYGMTGGDSNQELWSHRLIEQFQAGITTEAVLLVNANTEAKWFQPLYRYLICFTNHRIRFYNTSGESSQPTQGNAFIYFGHQESRFTELFKQFGSVVRRID